MNNESNFSVYIKLVFVMFFWGVSFVSGRILSLHYHPFSIAFLRFSIASIILVILLYRKNSQFYKISLAQFLKVFFLGLTGVFSYNFFFLSGLKTVEAGKSSILIATNPVFITLFAILFLKEKYSWKKMFGLVLALSGAIIVISKGNFNQLISGFLGKGEVSLLFAVLSWVIYTLFGKIALKKLTPLEAATWASFIGACLLFPFAWHFNLVQMIEYSIITDWLHVLNLSLFSTCFGFIWYYDGVSKIGAAKSSSFINLIPIFGVASGIIFLDEVPSSSLLIGACTVIIGVYFINKEKKIEAPAKIVMKD